MTKVRLYLECLSEETGIPGMLEINLWNTALTKPLYDYFTAHDVPCEMVSVNETVERNQIATDLLGSLDTSERRKEHG